METLKSKISDLEKAAEFMAQQQGNAQSTTGSANSSSDDKSQDDNVVDADYTEKN